MLPQSQRRSESEGEDESGVMNNKKTEAVKYDHNSKMVRNTWGTSQRKKTKQEKNIAAVIDQALNSIHYISAS